VAKLETKTKKNSQKNKTTPLSSSAKAHPMSMLRRVVPFTAFASASVALFASFLAGGIYSDVST
jgi:hypothetical protein